MHARCTAGAVHWVGWWCTPAAVALVARWAATFVVLAVGSAVSVCEVLLAMVPCAVVMNILVAAPHLVGVVWPRIE